jgi:Trp operon repressor
MQNKKSRANRDVIAREERRRKVAQYMQQSMSETEIAARLNVDAATVCRDVQALKQIANDFVYSLAKESLAVFYKDAIDNLLKARAKAWDMAQQSNPNSKKVQCQLAALKVAVASNQCMFDLLLNGPTVMSVKSLEEGLKELLQTQRQQRQSQQHNNNGVSA